MGIQNNNEQRVLLILERIKSFTQFCPVYQGIADPEYKIYLSKCTKLYELDCTITDILNLDLNPTEFEKMLLEIEKQVNEIIG